MLIISNLFINYYTTLFSIIKCILYTQCHIKVTIEEQVTDSVNLNNIIAIIIIVFA